MELAQMKLNLNKKQGGIRDRKVMALGSTAGGTG